MARRSVAFVAIIALAAACKAGTDAEAKSNLPSSTATTLNLSTPTTRPLIDSGAILELYGFEVCGFPLPTGEVTPERGQPILDDAGAAGIGNSGNLGSRVSVFLYVLDDASLSTLAQIAEPHEVCVEGQDPNDYVAPGPQLLSGNGWRWIGAGSPGTDGPRGLVTTQAEYNDLWLLLGEGPETEQVSIDFNREVILTINHGSGVNFGQCGAKIDGVVATADGVVIDWFRPGGHTICPASICPATYAIAIDLDISGQPPLQVGLRHGPRRTVEDFRTVSAQS